MLDGLEARYGAPAPPKVAKPLEMIFFISLVSQVAVPIGICSALQAAGNLTPTGIWLAIVVGHATRCGLSVLRFRQEKWRDIAVEAKPLPA